MLEATQNIVKRTVECVSKFALPVSDKSVVCHFLDFFKERSYQTEKKILTESINNKSLRKSLSIPKEFHRHIPNISLKICSNLS
jgi:hypothetical protein